MIGLRLGEAPQSVLCVGAHPDDIEIGAAGTIAWLADRYPEAGFTFAVLSGTDERRTEAERSMKELLGGRAVLDAADLADGMIPYAHATEAKEFLRKVAAEASAQLVIAPWEGDRHQDHSFVAHVVDQLQRDHLVLGYEVVKFDGDLGRPQLFVPLTETQVDAKVDHLAGNFHSQHGKHWYSAETFRALMRIRGVECNAPSGYAEAFHVSKLRLG